MAILKMFTPAIAMGLGLAMTFGVSPTGAVTKPATPKVGDCYSIPQNEINTPSGKSLLVNCSKSHNAETYRVGKWRGSANPSTLSEIDRRVVVETICLTNFTPNELLNAWSYKIPNSSQWRSGQRFVRCDAMFAVIESETVIYKSWKGKKLNTK